MRKVLEWNSSVLCSLVLFLECCTLDSMQKLLRHDTNAQLRKLKTHITYSSHLQKFLHRYKNVAWLEACLLPASLCRPGQVLL